MKCPNCGVENEEEARVCTICGAALNTEPEQPEEPAAETEPRVKVKKSELAILVLLGIAIVAALAVAVMVFVRRSIPKQPELVVTEAEEVPTETEEIPAETVELKPRYNVTAYESPALMPAESMDVTAVTFGKHQITNRELNYYYWSEYMRLANSYGANLSKLLNPSVPLGKQSMGQQYAGATWQDYFLEQAVDTLSETYALKALAENEGYTLPAEEEQYLTELEMGLRTFAKEEGYAELEDYLRASYGSGATEETFLPFLRDSIVASAYASELYNRDSYSREEIEAYYKANDYAAVGLEKTETYNINVRHILVMPEDGAETGWEDALAEAERILALWQENPTEEHFAALAGEYTQDPGSQSTGGLYSNVARGQMVQPFNDWCFDESRNPGDSGIVKTDYGYHIMYFVGQMEYPIWMMNVLSEMRSEAYHVAISNAIQKGGFSIKYENVVLAVPNGMYE